MGVEGPVRKRDGKQGKKKANFQKLHGGRWRKTANLGEFEESEFWVLDKIEEDFVGISENRWRECGESEI